MTTACGDQARKAGSALYTVGALLATIVAFGLAYAGPARLLVLRWYNDDFYSYAFLIPLISAYMLWSQRERVAASIGRPDYLLGVPTLLVSLAALLVGRAGSFAVLQQLSIIPALAGIVLLYGGRRALRAVSLPLLYLLFAVPIWDVFTDPLHEPFQQLTARIGQWAMTAMGVPSYLNDKVLQLPNVTLEVARACSGINYLISVVAIAIPYSYLSLSRTTRRAAVICFAVIVAILSNGLRVAFIGALQYYGISEPADLHGPYHVLQGMFVAVVGYAALFAGAWFLRERGEATHRPPPLPAPAPVSREFVSWAPVALAVGMLFFAALLVSYSDPRPVPVADSNWWPEAIGEWRVGSELIERTDLRADRPDSEFSRRYHSPGGETLDVYIAYFAVQKEGRKVMGFGGVTLPDSASRVVVPANGRQPADGGLRRAVRRVRRQTVRPGLVRPGRHDRGQRVQREARDAVEFRRPPAIERCGHHADARRTAGLRSRPRPCRPAGIRGGHAARGQALSRKRGGREMIREWRAGDERAWDAFVTGQPTARSCHLTAWKRVIETAFGQQTCYLVSEDAAGQIDGVLPVVRLRSRLFGDFLVSVPYLNYGGPCAADARLASELVHAASRAAESLGVQHLEVRMDSPGDYGLQVRTSKVSMRLGLPESVDDLWTRFPAKLRSQVKRAEREAATVTFGRDEEHLSAFYDVFAENMRDLGTPVYARRFFREILRELPESSWICCVRLGAAAGRGGLPRRVSRDARDPLGLVAPAIQPRQPEHAALLERPEVRLRARLRGFRFRTVEPRQQHVQVQGAVGGAARAAALALLGTKRRRSP